MERPVIPYENQLLVDMKSIYPTFLINLYIFHTFYILYKIVLLFYHFGARCNEMYVMRCKEM